MTGKFSVQTVNDNVDIFDDISEQVAYLLAVGDLLMSVEKEKINDETLVNAGWLVSTLARRIRELTQTTS